MFVCMFVSLGEWGGGGGVLNPRQLHWVTWVTSARKKERERRRRKKEKRKRIPTQAPNYARNETGAKTKQKIPNRIPYWAPGVQLLAMGARARLARHGGSGRCENTDWNHSTSRPQNLTAPVLIEKTRHPHPGLASWLIIRKTSPQKSFPQKLAPPGESWRFRGRN